MSKTVHQYVFDMQVFKKSEFGWVEKQYMYPKLNIEGVLHAVFDGKTTHLFER